MITLRGYCENAYCYYLVGWLGGKCGLVGWWVQLQCSAVSECARGRGRRQKSSVKPVVPHHQRTNTHAHTDACALTAGFTVCAVPSNNGTNDTPSKTSSAGKRIPASAATVGARSTNSTNAALRRGEVGIQGARIIKGTLVASSKFVICIEKGGWSVVCGVVCVVCGVEMLAK